MPGGTELIFIAILFLLIGFVTVAIKRQWYTQLFINVVFLLGLLVGILGVIDLVKDSETSGARGIIKIFVCLLGLLAGGYLQKKKDGATKETTEAADEPDPAESENEETEA